jgi:hypothetical protein
MPTLLVSFYRQPIWPLPDKYIEMQNRLNCGLLG